MKKNLKLFLTLLLFIAGTSGIFAQIKVTGTVIDASKQPIVGANVVVKGTTIGTMTDINGKYTLDVPSASSTITISFIGYVARDFIVGNNNVIDATLESEARSLEEVVVVGYGTQKRANLTGTVATVGGAELVDYPVASAGIALQGKIPGVSITSIDGRPNATINIRVRGGGSVTQSNDPLFIVDGFPVSNINNIPASQIEDISVLKDASSAAIYGARGANGVVIITTKSPKAGKLNISYDGSFQVKKLSKYLEFLDGYDFVLANWEFGTLMSYGDAWEMAYGLGTKYSSLNPGGINAYKTAEYRDMQKDLLQTAYTWNHSLNLSGGNENSKFSLSFDNIDDQGIKIMSWYKRNVIIGKFQQKLAKGLILDVAAHVTSSSTFGSEGSSSYSGSSLTSGMRFTPVTPLGDISGANSQIGMYETWVRPNFDPLLTIKDVYSLSTSQSYRGTADLAWTIIDGLTLRTEYDYSLSYGKSYNFTGPIAKNTVGAEGGDASVGKSNGQSYRWVNTLNYALKFLPMAHQMDVMLGQEVTNSESESTSISGTKYPISFDYKKAFAMMNQYGNQTEIRLNNSYGVPDRMLSYFGRINYGFRDRYLMTFTLRADGSSNFAPTHRWGYFPAISVGWRISEESFMKGISAINNLKLRLSYGEAGNDRISSGLWKSEWSASSNGYSYLDIGNSYYVPASSQMTNPDLKWETTITRDIGLDFSLLKDRIHGTVDGYWNTTKDLLMLIQIPGYTGYTTQMQNAGQTRNTGLEVSLGGDIIRKNDLKVSANFNISFNRNKVESLSENMDHYYYGTGWASNSTRPASGDYALIVGQPIGLIRGFVYDGFYTTSDFTYDDVTKTYTLKDGVANSRTVLGLIPGVTAGSYPGMAKFKKIGTTQSATEVNETDDCVIIGNPNPKHIGGFNINSSYKGLDLLLAFNWSYGNDVYNTQRLADSYGAKIPFHNFSSAASNWYHLFKVDENGNLVRVYDPAELDALNVNTTTQYPFNELGVANSSGIEDGSFLRLNNVTLGYTLPSSLTKKVAIQSLRIYGTIYNAYTWTNYTGFDPEVSTRSTGTYPTPGMDFGSYPRSRTFTLGLSVNF